MTPLTSSSTEFDYVNILQQQDFTASEETKEDSADENTSLIALPQTPQELPATIENTPEAPSAIGTTTDSYIYNLESIPLLVCKEQYDAIVQLTNENIFRQGNRMFNFYYENKARTYYVISEVLNPHPHISGPNDWLPMLGGGVGMALSAALAFYSYGTFINPQLGFFMNYLRLSLYSQLGFTTFASAQALTKRVQEDAKSTYYWLWCQKKKEESLYPFYQGIITQEGHPLHKYTCPFTKNLIKCPYKTPKGRVYEKDAIEAWLKSDTVKDIIKCAKAAQTAQEQKQLLLQTSPSGDEILVTGEKLDRWEISYCWEYHGDVCKAMQRYREGQMQVLCERERDLISEGLKNYRKSIQKTAREMMGALNQLNEKLRWEKKISDERYYAEHRKISEYYMLFSEAKSEEEKQEESKINA
jgi:hypothetical protein